MNLSRLLVLAALCGCLNSLHAQPLPNTLLWRITGKDGHRTSWLYGTMHLTDERVFNLGDSLYSAIHNSEGLAIELDPSSLVTFLAEELEKRVEDQRNVKEMLSAKEYKSYGPLLAKKLGKPLRDITSQDILNEKNKWVQQSYKTGKMSTFLDVYLYDIARRQQKWTGGVEDLADQQGLFDDIVDKSDIVDLVANDEPGKESNKDSVLQQMVSIYLQQDLNALDTFFSGQADRDRILVKRNLKMAQRMDSLSGMRSMVFCVGAAHLPGKDGLITLLRARGFQVEPVFSSRKIRSADYPVPELPDTWTSITDDNGLYKVELPGKSGDLTLYGIMKMKMYVDFIKGTGYVTTAVHSSFSRNKTDSLMDVMAERMFSKGRKKEFTPLQIDGAKGRAYSIADADGFKKGYMLEKDGIVYLAFGSAVKGTDKNRADIDHFLHSFHLLERKPDADNVKMERFTDSGRSFSVLVPATPKEFPVKNPGWNSRLYVCSDAIDGIYCFFGATSAKAAHYVENDSTLFVSLKKELVKRMKQVDEDTIWSENGRYIAEIKGMMKEADMQSTSRLIGRGNRWYSLLVMYPLSAPTAKVEKFLSSFTELPYPAAQFQQTRTHDSVFSTWSPGNFVLQMKDSTQTTGTRTYTCYDSLRAMSYDVVVFRLSPYYWSLSDSAFWKDRIAAHSTFLDSVIYKKPVTNGATKGWEWVVQLRGSHLYRRERLLLDGEQLYAVEINSTEDGLHSPDNERFFTEFRLPKPTEGNSYLQSKADRLLSDLFAEDSITAARAYATLRQVHFEKKDLPLLYTSLLKVSVLDRKEKTFRKVNRGVMEAIKDLGDTGTLRFAAGHYPAIPDSNAFIRSSLLTLMAIPDSTHFAELFHLMHSYPPTEALPYAVTNQLADTLTLTARFSSEFLPLLKDSMVANQFTRLTMQLLDSGYLNTAALAPYRELLQDRAASRLRELTRDIESYHYGDDWVVHVIGYFNDTKSLALLTKYLSVKDKDIQVEAVVGLARNHQPVDPAIVLSLAGDKAHRLDLYTRLKTVGRTGLFPTVWRTQKAMGEAEVFRVAMDDDDLNTDDMKIQLLREKQKGTRRFLFYKLSTGGTTWLACAGPYDQDPANLILPGISAHIYYKEEYSEKKSAEQMELLLKKFD